jgi:2-polyprenyl-3-methyl-5-hydroxy-6-metoxy-1,4-benzoquinol methylase
VEGYEQLPRVTSDCCPWQSGGKLGTCTRCGCAQNPTDQQWLGEIKEIYGKYSIYQQGSGNEQFVFTGGQPVARSARLMEMTSPFLDLSAQGRLLDFGCANGGLLRNFARLNSNWTMVGFEVDDKHKQEIEAIAAVESFSSGSVESIPGRFNLITMSHVLEHLPLPASTLSELSQKLTAGGYLLIQVPDAAQNPFDLVIADHCSHFTLHGLKQLVANAGYRIVVATTDWVPKEISILATTLSANESGLERSWEGEPRLNAAESIAWLARVQIELRKLRAVDRLGIFGSSIAATWLYAALEGKVDFFVDEDPNRVGQKHLDRPIYSIDQVPPDSHVFVGMNPEKATQVAERLAIGDFHVHLPPAC